VSRDTQNVVLVLLGGALVKIGWTDLYLRYVKPGNRGYLLAAGTVILLLAAVSLVRDARAARTAPARPSPALPDPARSDPARYDPARYDPARYDPARSDPARSDPARLEPAQPDSHRGPYSPWLLVLPVLAILLVAPPALGSDSVRRASLGNSVSAAGGAAFPPLPAGDAPELRLSDFVARAVWEGSGNSAELVGRDVMLTGFVVHRAGATELARLVITCCAADARPMVVRLTGAPDLPSGTWLRVRARLHPGSATPADGYTPTVSVLDAATIPEPAEAYEY
jgi:uncharacterized repeat protein (TIGR03943 family)